MSTYHMAMGMNPLAGPFLAVLGRGPEEFGRLRDLWLQDDGDLDLRIVVHTRCGGSNRERYKAMFESLEKDPKYLRDYDCDYDSTYANIEFKIPAEHREIIDACIAEAERLGKRHVIVDNRTQKQRWRDCGLPGLGEIMPKANKKPKPSDRLKGLPDIEPNPATEDIKFDPRLAHVDCMIEATSFEQHALWAEFRTLCNQHNKDMRWEGDSLGKYSKIGELAGFPIVVGWTFAVVDGAVLCFYEATSRVVDHGLVRKWANAICPTHTNAMNFHNRVQSDTETSNVAKYRAAVEIMREERRKAWEAELAKPPTPQAPEDEMLACEALLVGGIPEISDERLARKLEIVTPIDGETQKTIYLPEDLRGVAYTWDPTFGSRMAGIEPAKTIKTLHTYGAPSLFKPSIAEVLAQAPEDLEEYVAFSIQGPKTAEDMNRYRTCTSAGYHVAEVTYWRRKKKGKNGIHA